MRRAKRRVLPLTFGTCSLSYSTDEVGLQVITAQYSGDANNAPCDGTIHLRNPEASLTTLGCSRASDPEGTPTTCAVNVSGFFPTRTVLFWSNGSEEFPSRASCSLTLGSCSVTYVPSAAGQQTLFAWYEGDSNNSASSG